ncbi:MAG: response regulator [Hyphomicrobiales bacterium]|nr:MAG: response regulator [Hyphomicrobiales bacterium]
MTEPNLTHADLPPRLLLIDGGRQLQARIAASLAAEFEAAPVVVEITAGRSALDLLRTSTFDAIVADLDALADISDRADDRIGRLARASSGALVIVLSADAGISVALAAMRAGAHDCIGKAIDGPRLTTLIGELARRHGKARCLTRNLPPMEPAAPVTQLAAPSIPNMRDLVMPMWRQEQRIIEEAIQQFAGNVALAAAALELSPSTIYRKRQAWAEMDDRRGAA